MAKLIKTYEKEKSPLYKMNSRKKLCELFWIADYKQLDSLALDKGNYNLFPIPKGNGKLRPVEEPKGKLKKFQADFNRLLQRISVPEFVKAGVKGSCYVNNGQVHKDGKYFYCTDVEKFFPNAKRENVFQFLLYNMVIANDIALLLSNILTYDDHLPTGSPSSQLLTYWAYKKTFNDIYEKACGNDIMMTLFVDDLTFSSNEKIPEVFINYVKTRLESEGLKINKKKRKKYSSAAYKKVTGTIVTPKNKLEVPNKQRAKIRSLINKTDKTEKEIESLKGLLNAARQIEHNFMESDYKKLMHPACKLG